MYRIWEKWSAGRTWSSSNTCGYNQEICICRYSAELCQSVITLHSELSVSAMSGLSSFMIEQVSLSLWKSIWGLNFSSYDHCCCFTSQWMFMIAQPFFIWSQLCAARKIRDSCVCPWHYSWGDSCVRPWLAQASCVRPVWHERSAVFGQEDSCVRPWHLL